MCKLSAFIALCCCCIVSTLAFDVVVEDSNGFRYYLVPVQARVKRGTTELENGSRNAGVKHTHVFVDDKNHNLQGSVFATRDLKHPNQPLTTGGSADYLHKPSASSFSLSTQNTRGEGSQVKASGQYNFFQTQDKRGTLGLSGDYSRTYGGPYGTGQPNYGVFLKGQYTM